MFELHNILILNALTPHWLNRKSGLQTATQLGVTCHPSTRCRRQRCLLLSVGTAPDGSPDTARPPLRDGLRGLGSK